MQKWIGEMVCLSILCNSTKHWLHKSQCLALLFKAALPSVVSWLGDAWVSMTCTSNAKTEQTFTRPFKKNCYLVKHPPCLETHPACGFFQAFLATSLLTRCTVF